MPHGNVYVIENDRNLRNLLEALLAEVGYSVQTWSDPLAFLKETPAAIPAVILTDVHMPELSGIELHAELKRRGNTLPIIYMSADSSDSLRTEAMKHGPVGFLSKPFWPDELFASIARGLEVGA